MREPVLTVTEVTAFLEEVFPQIDGQFVIEAVGPMTARVRMPADTRRLRPGGTISGPAMFGLADCAFYVAVLAMIGREALTVTTNCSIDFMRKPAAVDMVAEVRLLKLGRLLAVGDVLLYSEGMAEPVARASLTYAIPPKP